MNENMIYCSRCGTQNPEQAAFCRQCGAGLGTNLPAPASPAYTAPIAYAAAGSSVRYGGFWIRFVAIVIDWIVLAVVSWPIRVILFGIFHVPRYHWGPDYDGNLGPLFAVVPAIFSVNIVINWLYEALMMSSTWQATLGKKALGLWVTDEAGDRISFARASGRHFAKYISALILCFGYLMAAFMDRKRALHDILAGTLVRKS
jgi:uncharacterized RDD family membrane protein YckC